MPVNYSTPLPAGPGYCLVHNLVSYLSTNRRHDIKLPQVLMQDLQSMASQQSLTIYCDNPLIFH